MIIYLWTVKYIGVHLWDLYTTEVDSAVLLISICTIVYMPLMALAKLSLLCFYRKLSSDKWFKRAIYSTMAFVICYSIALTCALIVVSTPIMRNWEIRVAYGANKRTIYLLTASLSAATDLILVILPMPVVARLECSGVQKLGLIAMFSVGSM